MPPVDLTLHDELRYHTIYFVGGPLDGETHKLAAHEIVDGTVQFSTPVRDRSGRPHLMICHYRLEPDLEDANFACGVHEWTTD